METPDAEQGFFFSLISPDNIIFFFDTISSCLRVLCSNWVNFPPTDVAHNKDVATFFCIPILRID